MLTRRSRAEIIRVVNKVGSPCVEALTYDRQINSIVFCCKDLPNQPKPVILIMSPLL